MTTRQGTEDLRLIRAGGPNVEPIQIPPDNTVTIGRGLDCEVSLADPGVSRHHAAISQKGGRWFIKDLGSRHGTMLNAVQIPPNQPAALDEGDLIQIDPWTFRVSFRDETAIGYGETIVPMTDTKELQRVERVANRDLVVRAHHRLHLLIDSAAMIHSATDDESLAKLAIDAAISGSGFRRAALIRSLEGTSDVEVLHSRSEEGVSDNWTFSRSLIEAASSGQIARLAADQPARFGDSIVSLGIHSAMCAPIMMGSAISAYLYLDARGQESPVQPDAAGFCEAIARMYALAMANLAREELEKRQKRLDGEISAAREAQQYIVPAERGKLSGLSYAVRMRPGRFVAGDLFDVVALPDDKVAVFLGDVTGEGVGAAILMATTQAHLHASLIRFGDPAAALNSANRYVTERSPSNKFVSLWVAVFDVRNQVCRYVDAGHGHWIFRSAGQAPKAAGLPNGLLVGIDGSYEYQAAELKVATGDRIILFSDGVVEQVDPDGEQFGMERAIDQIARAESADQDVVQLFEAVNAFAQTSELSDDTTIASLEFLG